MSARLRRYPIPLAFGVVAVCATAALAATTISIKDSQVPVKASAFEEQESCADLPGAAGPDGSWGWHFVLPGGEATFVSLTAHFETAGDVTLPGPSGSFVQNGKGAVIFTPTDDTLTGAVATIEGETPQGYFVLSHTCVPGPSPSPSVSASETSSPSASSSASTSVSPTAEVSGTATSTPSESGSPSESASVTPSAEVSGTQLSQTPSSSITPNVLGVKQTRGGVAGTSLPTTGLAPFGLVALAGLLVAGGVILMARRPAGRHVH